MSFITKWAFGNKAAVALTTILILIIGVVSYFRLPMEFLPAADNPQVTIITMGQGTDSKTMETEVTVPMERAVTGMNGKKSVYHPLQYYKMRSAQQASSIKMVKLIFVSLPL